jgi:predicted phosphodiesterase
MRIQFVGDIHGNIQAIDALRLNHTQYDLTIQVGDFGIGFGAEGYLGYFDPNLFKILFGNHDNYFTLSQYPHNLGRFGIYNFNGYKIFFIGGAWSRDWQCRTEWISWWHDEELSMKEGSDCLDLWEQNCKEINLIVSHDCPLEIYQDILNIVPNNTNTQRLLSEIWTIYAPPKWIFGHYHQSYVKQIGNCEFRCLNINEPYIWEVNN